MNEPHCQSTLPRPPKGRTADDRLIRSIVELRDQFGVCGLELPIAILVAPGQARQIKSMIAGSPWLLFEDTHASQLQIWGVAIREEEAS